VRFRSVTKLHGALYHAVDDDPALARSYLQRVAKTWPSLVIVARAADRLPLRTDLGIEVWQEAFLDRGYRADGTLVPRGEPAR
jgi:UPF0271 protein